MTSTVEICEIPKKIVRYRDGQLAEKKKQIKELDGKTGEVDKLKTKGTNLQQCVYYYQGQVETKESALKDCQQSLRRAQHAEAKARSEIRRLELKVDDLQSQLEEGEKSPFICTMAGGQYTDEIRKCCLELLSLNVGVWNVGHVIRSVLAVVGLKAERLPRVGLLSQMLVELKQVSSIQVEEGVTGVGPTTLHSDGMTKFGKKFGSFQIATASEMFTVGVVDMKCGTAQHTLDKLKEVLVDVEGACSNGQERLDAKNILKEL